MKVYNLAADETDMQTNTQIDRFLHIVMVITGEDDGVGIYFRLAWGSVRSCGRQLGNRDLKHEQDLAR